MKKAVYFILLLALTLSSCNMAKLAVINVSSGTDASEPNKGNFIKTKSGKEISLPDNSEISSSLLAFNQTNTVKIGDRKFKGKDISVFQVNGDYYANTAKNTFAKRIYRGPLNIYTNTTSTTYVSSGSNSSFGGGGGLSQTTTYHINYFVQKPNINKGAPTLIYATSSNKELEPYLKDYKPSYDILKKYQQQRHISRIVKFSVLGLWLSSIPLALLAKNNDALTTVAAANFSLGLFIYVPAVSIRFKYHNHVRPYEAVQKYIDNNFIDEPPVAKKITPAVASDSIGTESSKNPNGDISADFIELNNGKIITADLGTKLKSANNKIFIINNEKYTDGITAFQSNKKFYKKFSDMKEESDFAQRTIDGKISVYTATKNEWETISANSGSSLWSGNKEGEYFQKKGTNEYYTNRTKLVPLFEDNPVVADMYHSYIRHVHTGKTIRYSLLTGLLVSFIAPLAIGKPGAAIALYGVGTTCGIVGITSMIRQHGKRDREFTKILDAYNNDKKSRILTRKDN